MKMTSFKNKIKDILANLLECTPETILDETSLFDLGYDSLKFISMIVELEKAFGIEILDSDLMLDNFSDLKTICKTLDKYLNINIQDIVKCVIVDCDGVLWRGISGESGNDQAYSDQMTNMLCEFLHNLRTKGILLAICSKNSYINIETMLDHTPLNVDDFAIIETNVHSKIDSLSNILNEFGFFVSNVLYIDDSDAELAYINSRYPKLATIKADYNIDFLSCLLSLFQDLPENTIIDRTTKFLEQKEREKTHLITSSPDEYNQILQTKIICKIAAIEDIERLAELSHRANRFNLTGARYSSDELTQMMNISDYTVFKLCASDKYGDMGLVAMAVVHKNIIESFIMSCRAFGRKFEYTLLNTILKTYKNELIGRYHPTEKNDYCKDFYLNCGIKYELC